MSAPFEEISQLLADYFDMLYFGVVDRLRRVFHPPALYARRTTSRSGSTRSGVRGRAGRA